MKKKINPLTMGGCILLFLVLGAAFLAPWVSRTNPQAIHLEKALVPPGPEHLMGTDQLGRDVFARMLYGARISLLVGFIAVGLSTLVGLVIGAISGYFGGKVDSAIMRLVDIMLCFPALFLILAAVAFLEPNLTNIMVIIGLTGWMGVARLVRAEVLSLKERDFIQAARGIGASPARIIFRHLLPNAMGPIIVSATLGVGSAILIESALSFLGLGVQPPTPSWGNILAEGKATLGVAPWLLIIPGLAICWVVLGFHLLAEGMRKSWSGE